MSGGSETVQVVSGSAETSGLQPCIVEKALQELAGMIQKGIVLVSDIITITIIIILILRLI